MPENADPWQKATQISAHPITAFRMIRRFAAEFDAIGSHISQQLEKRKNIFLKFKCILNFG